MFSRLLKVLLVLVAQIMTKRPCVQGSQKGFYNYVDVNHTVSSYLAMILDLYSEPCSFEEDILLMNMNHKFYLPINTCFTTNLNSLISMKYICNSDNETHPIVKLLYNDDSCQSSNVIESIALGTRGTSGTRGDDSMEEVIIDYNCNGYSNCHSIIQFSNLNESDFIQLPIVTQVCVEDVKQSSYFEYECYSKMGIYGINWGYNECDSHSDDIDKYLIWNATNNDISKRHIMDTNETMNIVNITMIECGCSNAESTDTSSNDDNDKDKMSFKQWFLAYDWIIPIIVFAAGTICFCAFRICRCYHNNRRNAQYGQNSNCTCQCQRNVAICCTNIRQCICCLWGLCIADEQRQRKRAARQMQLVNDQEDEINDIEGFASPNVNYEQNENTPGNVNIHCAQIQQEGVPGW